MLGPVARMHASIVQDAAPTVVCRVRWRLTRVGFGFREGLWLMAGRLVL